MRPSRCAVGLTVALLATLPGCGSRPSAHRVETPPARASGPADSLDELPAELARPAIGPRDSLMRGLASPLAEWVELWKAARSEFALDSLRFAGRSPFHPQPDAVPWEFPGSSDPEGLN